MRFAPIIVALVAVLAVGVASATTELENCQETCTEGNVQSACAAFNQFIATQTGRESSVRACDDSQCQVIVPGPCGGLAANYTGQGFTNIEFWTERAQEITVQPDLTDPSQCPPEKQFASLHADDLIPDFNISLAHNTDNGDGTSQICWNVEKITTKASTELRTFTIGICDAVAASITNLGGGFLEPNPKVRNFQGISFNYDGTTNQFCIELNKVYQMGNLTTAMQYKTGVTVIGSDIAQQVTVGPRCCPYEYQCVFEQKCERDTAESCAEWSNDGNKCADGDQLIENPFATECGSDDTRPCDEVCCVDTPSCEEYWGMNEPTCPVGSQMINTADTPCASAMECAALCCGDIPSCNNFFEGAECPVGSAPNGAGDHAPCTGDECAEVCCDDIPSCNNFFEGAECPVGSAPNGASDHAACGGADQEACETACCDDIPSCNNFFEGAECPIGSAPNSAGPHTACGGDDQEACETACCDDFYSCDQFSSQCMEGTRFVESEDNFLKRCDDGEGSPSCQDECCVDIHTCSDFSCPQPLVSISGTGQTECDPAGDECVTLCCTEPECPVWWVDCGCTKVAPVKDDGKTVAIAFRSKEASHEVPRCEPSRDH